MNIKTTEWKEKEIWKGKMRKEIARHNYKIKILLPNDLMNILFVLIPLRLIFHSYTYNTTKNQSYILNWTNSLIINSTPQIEEHT